MTLHEQAVTPVADESQERCPRCGAQFEWRHQTLQCPRCRFKVGCCEGTTGDCER